MVVSISPTAPTPDQGAKPLYETLRDRLCKEQALIGEAASKTAVAADREFAAREPGGPICRYCRPPAPLGAGDALEVTVLRADKDAFSYDVHRCRYAEMYREMGIGEIGYRLSCNRDHASSWDTTPARS